mmetsp:Transcript_3519/g.22137  ORF Transcript_3519/g.22137 Transcript_3519/m.22137 type:complete len:171 (-) Transcript_3519:2022-2534(-)
MTFPRTNTPASRISPTSSSPVYRYSMCDSNKLPCDTSIACPCHQGLRQLGVQEQGLDGTPFVGFSSAVGVAQLDAACGFRWETLAAVAGVSQRISCTGQLGGKPSQRVECDHQGMPRHAKARGWQRFAIVRLPPVANRARSKQERNAPFGIRGVCTAATSQWFEVARGTH